MGQLAGDDQFCCRVTGHREKFRMQVQRQLQESTPAFQLGQPVGLTLWCALRQRQTAGDAEDLADIAGPQFDAGTVRLGQRDKARMTQISERGLRRKKVFAGLGHDGSVFRSVRMV